MKKKLAVLLVLMLAVMSAVVGCGGTSSSGERTVTAVSYTHLDVYKRQVMGRELVSPMAWAI